MLELIATTAPEHFIPQPWPHDATMFLLMAQWRKLLARQYLQGDNKGDDETRFRLIGALLACGLTFKAAVKQAHHLQKHAIQELWLENGGSDLLRQRAIIHALTQNT